MSIQHPKVLLVVVTEAVIERAVLTEARARGVQAWTISEVRAGSSEGEREGSWEADRTVEIKLICEAAMADALAAHVLEVYAPHYQVVLYVAPVAVFRADRY
jgi:hypothetical protein